MAIARQNRISYEHPKHYTLLSTRNENKITWWLVKSSDGWTTVEELLLSSCPWCAQARTGHIPNDKPL
jgi:hypothetical protein